MSSLPLATNGTNEDIRDIRGPVEIGETIPWLVLLLALAAILAALVFWLRSRKGNESGPEMPAADRIALEALENARQWMEVAHAKRFAAVVSAIVRTYIAARFEIDAPRATTEEFLRDLLQTPAPDLEGHRSLLAAFLEQTDLVKFARVPLDTREMERLLGTAQEFVRETRPTEGETR